jgi:hypothetical protein
MFSARIHPGSIGATVALVAPSNKSHRLKALENSPQFFVGIAQYVLLEDVQYSQVSAM